VTPSRNKRGRSAAGFTLVEVAIAVAILGVSLATLLTLQTRYIRIYLSEENQTRAALYAQYLMTMLDLAEELPEAGTKSGPLLDVLQQQGYFDKNVPPQEKERLKEWDYDQTVTSEDYGDAVDIMRRISLKLSWGPSESESFSLIYYVRTGKQQKAAAG
jgi:prepilin-type N-terminal cleavage/methylation domain-containing protein